MPHTEDYWRERITVTCTGTRRRYYTATCPVCGDSQDADVLGSDSVAQHTARSKVMTHLKMKHADEIIPQIADAAE